MVPPLLPQRDDGLNLLGLVYRLCSPLRLLHPLRSDARLPGSDVGRFHQKCFICMWVVLLAGSGGVVGVLITHQ